MTHSSAGSFQYSNIIEIGSSSLITIHSKAIYPYQNPEEPGSRFQDALVDVSVGISVNFLDFASIRVILKFRTSPVWQNRTFECVPGHDEDRDEDGERREDVPPEAADDGGGQVGMLVARGALVGAERAVEPLAAVAVVGPLPSSSGRGGSRSLGGRGSTGSVVPAKSKTIPNLK